MYVNPSRHLRRENRSCVSETGLKLAPRHARLAGVGMEKNAPMPLLFPQATLDMT
jgi:hypothetical protein